MNGTLGIGEIWTEGRIEFYSIEHVRIYGIVNDHGHADISGIIKKEQAEELMSDSFENEHLILRAKDRERPLFSGCIKSVRFSGEGDLYRLFVTCISFTSLLNKEKHSRSFQDTAMRYRDLLNEVREGGRDKGRFVITANNAAREIEKPIIQYEETDWEFLKRITGRLHTLLIPEITYPMVQLSIGAIQGACYELTKSYEYEEIFDFDALRSNENYDSKENYISYRLKSFEIYELGDRIHWNGKEYRILEKELCFDTGIMEGTYLLGFIKGHCMKEHSNDRLTGASFSGTVIGRAEGKLKVHLDMDQIQKPENAYWYDYSPVTANVMYSMPELGARVLLNIMGEEESNALVSCCIRKESRVLPLPEVKMMWTGLETYVAAPDYMGFCYEGMRSTEALVVDDEIGLIVNTGKKLKMKAAGRVLLKGSAGVSFNGVRTVFLAHPNAKDEQAWIAMDCGRLRLGASSIVHSGGMINGAENYGMELENINLRKVGNDVLAMIPVAAGGKGYDSISTAIYKNMESSSLQSFESDTEAVSMMEESQETKGEKVKDAKIYIGGYLMLRGQVYEDGKTYIFENMSTETILDKFLTGVDSDKFKRDEPVYDEQFGGTRYYKPEYYTLCIEDLAEKTGYADILSSWEQSDNLRIVVCHALAKKAPYQLVRNKEQIKIKFYLKVNAYEKDDQEDPLVYTTKPYEDEYRWKYSKKPDYRQYTFYDFLTKGIQLWEGLYDNQSKDGLIYDDFGLDGHVNVKIEFCKADGLPIEEIRVYIFDNREEAVDNKSVYIPLEGDLIINKDFNWSQKRSGFSINAIASVLVFTRTIGGWMRETKNSTHFLKTFTHEFGHVFGLIDAYDKRFQGPNSNKDWLGAPKTDEVSNDNMMRNMKNVEPNDIEMILQAWLEGKYQYYFTYKEFTKSKVVRLDK